MTKPWLALGVIVTAIWSSSAAAHDGKGPNGGRLVDTGSHHLELIVLNDAIDVFVSTKANEPVAATELTGLAVVVAKGATRRIALAASGTTKLSGKADANLAPDTKTVVRVTLADGRTIQASFD